MKKRFVIPTLFALSASGLQAESLKDTQFIGYFRSTLGAAQGPGMPVFQAPGARAKYRLGNEPDTVFEAGLDHRFSAGANAPANSYLQGVFMISAYAGVGGASDLQFDDVAQAYVKMSRYLGDFDVWAGRRYYDRKSTDINDYFWLNTIQGAHIGAGIEDLGLGAGRLDFAIANYEDNGVTAIGDDTVKGTLHSRIFDLRYRDIKLGEANNLGFWLGYTQRPEDKTLNYKARNGTGAAFWLNSNLGKSKNSLYAITRKGVNFTQGGAIPVRENSGDGYDLKKVNYVEVGNAYSLSTETYNLDFLALHHTEQTGVDGTAGDSIVWSSAGIRPVVYLTTYTNLALELGHDQVKNELTDTNGSVDKATVALQLMKEKSAGVRPTIRLFGTHAQWSKDFKGAVAQSSYANKTQGWSAGVQTEVWW